MTTQSPCIGPLSAEAQAGLRTIAEGFIQPTAADYALLFRLAEEQFFAPKAVVIPAGAPSNRIHLLLAGVARHRRHHAGHRHTVGFSMPGQFVADLTNLTSQQPSQLDFIAVTRLHTVTIGSAVREQLFAASPVWRQWSRLILEAHTRYLAERAISLQIDSSKVRYEALMRQHPTLFNLVPLNQLASYLGIAKETLSRLRGRIGKGLAEPR